MTEVCFDVGLIAKVQEIILKKVDNREKWNDNFSCKKDNKLFGNWTKAELYKWARENSQDLVPWEVIKNNLKLSVT